MLLVELDNRLYSIKNGQLYQHNSETVPRNTFYGTQYPSKISTIFNEAPSDIKVFQTFNIEGSDPWDVSITAYVF